MGKVDKNCYVKLFCLRPELSRRISHRVQKKEPLQNLGLGLISSPPAVSWTLFLRKWRRDGLSDIFSTKFYGKNSLHLAKNYIVRDPAAGFVIVNDLGLLVYLRGQVFLAEALCLPSLLNEASNIIIDAFVLQFFSFTVEFCSVSGWGMLFVLTSVN